MLSHATLLTVAASLVLAAAATGARAERPSTDLAQAADATPQTRVEYADLDLKSAAGARTLGARLRAATLRVCAAPEGDRLGERTDETHCEQVALASARRAFEAQQVAINPLAWTVAER